MSKIIAIDGFSSCGKSTFARAIADKLGYIFIDTGAMYRAVTLYAVRNYLSDDELVLLLNMVNVDFRYSARLGRSAILLNGENVDKEIRSVEVNEIVSHIAGLSEVRAKLVDMQRAMGRKGGVVMDGRDIGTVVFPKADIKIFMTADPAVRARRRFDEMEGAVPLEEIEQNIRARDYADQNREDSPLRQADDAIVLDNSNMTVEQQMDWFDTQFKIHNA